MDHLWVWERERLVKRQTGTRRLSDRFNEKLSLKQREISEKSNEEIVAAGAEMKRGYGEEYWCLPGQKLYCLHFTSVLLTANQRVSADLHGVVHSGFCVFLETNKKQFSLRCWKWVSLSAERKPSLYVYANFSFSLHPADFEQWWYSDYCLTPTHSSCGIQRSQNPSLSPFSPMKGNWKQRLQLVRQLDSCFVSSTHPQTLIAYSFLLPSFICPSLAPLWGGSHLALRSV